MATPNTNRKEKSIGNDLYNTPDNALQAALDAGVFDRFDFYYDPCNGLGAISDFLSSKAGKNVITSDLIDYGINDTIADFLTLESVPDNIDCIVFNPPFLLTKEFLDHALSLCDNVIMFNRATTLETIERSERHLSKEWTLDTFYSHSKRMSCTKGASREETANSVWYGWFFYSKKSRRENPIIKWI